jgi:mevalonate kinase
MYERNFRANGKLLITGEYFVLDGAEALALPTRFGQTMNVRTTHDFDYLLYWQSYDNLQQCWFEVVINTQDFSIIETSDLLVAERLQAMLRVAKSMNSYIFNEKQGFRVRTTLEFPRNWGLGSSSTLIYNLAQWFEINPFELLAKTMGGSGYDIACAGVKTPIMFRRDAKLPHYEKVNFDPQFKSQIYFVHLTQKQDSREGIARYRSKIADSPLLIEEVTQLTQAALAAKDFDTFIRLMEQHEAFVSYHLDLPTAKKIHFADFAGSIKSLGAWGGDFVMAMSNESEKDIKSYFTKKGFPTILSYAEMIL